MSLFMLIRHAHAEHIGRILAGRSPGINLSEAGLNQSRQMAMRIAELPVTAIYSSPLERAVQTAAPIGERCGLAVQVREELNEVDAGEWTGRAFDDLRRDPIFERYNRLRGTTRMPGGELSADVQTRMVTLLEELRAEHPNGLLALVSHGDPIRTAIVTYLGLPLDSLQRLEIDPASVTLLRIEDWGAQLQRLNDTGSLAEVRR